MIDIHNVTDEFGWQGEWPGIVRPKLTWEVNKQNYGKKNN